MKKCTFCNKDCFINLLNETDQTIFILKQFDYWLCKDCCEKITRIYGKEIQKLHLKFLYKEIDFYNYIKDNDITDYKRKEDLYNDMTKRCCNNIKKLFNVIKQEFKYDR